MANAYTQAQQTYIASVDGSAHQSAVDIIGRLSATLDHVVRDRDKVIAERDRLRDGIRRILETANAAACTPR